MKKEWLTGWKPIANYLDVSISTAVRWAKKYNMPIIRTHSKKPTVEIEKLKEWRYKANLYQKLLKRG